MARKIELPQQSPERITALVMLAAIPKLKRRIEELRGLEPNSVQDRSDTRFRSVVTKIDDTLSEIFGRNSIEYRRNRIATLDTAPYNMAHPTPLPAVRAGYQRGIEGAISTLQTIIDLFEEKLEDQQNSPEIAPAQSSSTQPFSDQQLVAQSHKIFLVHGHDDGLLHEVARFLEKLQQEVVVLREQPSAGRTIIEKFVEYADVGYAVILLTPDDRGGAATAIFEHQRPRARQNVIFELGYFLGRLGRNRVTALYLSDVEIPSDYSGVAFVAADDRGAWRLELAKELKTAGFNIDMNLAF